MFSDKHVVNVNRDDEIKLAAVVVTYNPSRANLRNLIARCTPSSQWVMIVDNGSCDDLEWLELVSDKVKLIRLGQNFGIAHAQNVGISAAKALGVTKVVLFDQDSSPGLDMIPKLVIALDQLLSKGHKVACVGPRYFDKRQNNTVPFVKVEGLKLTRARLSSKEDVVPVDHLIASGSVIPTKSLDLVGGMREELFIDYVDLEWCERAKSMGYQSYGVCAAKMVHALGDEPICFFGKAYPARSPLRHYYMFRNAIWMYRQSYVRWNWKIVDGLRLVRKYVFYSLLARPRHQHFWMMSKGIFHGLIGRMGKYSG